MITFKQWLENFYGQIHYIPDEGNATWERGDINSKYFSKNRSFADLPPGDEDEIKDKGPEAKFGFNAKDKKIKPRTNPRFIDKGRTSPSRTTRIYT